MVCIHPGFPATPLSIPPRTFSLNTFSPWNLMSSKISIWPSHCFKPKFLFPLVYLPSPQKMERKQIFFRFIKEGWLGLLVISTDTLENSLIIHQFLWHQRSVGQPWYWDQWDPTCPLWTFLTQVHYHRWPFREDQSNNIPLPGSLSEAFSWAHCTSLCQNTSLRACLAGNLSP